MSKMWESSSGGRCGSVQAGVLRRPVTQTCTEDIVCLHVILTASCGKSTQVWGAGRAESQPCLQMLRHPHAACPPHGSALSWEVGEVERWAIHMEIQGPREGAGLPVASQGRAALPCGSHMPPLLPRPGCQTRMGVSQGPRETGFVRASELKPCTAWPEARDLAEITGLLSW